MAIWQFTIYLVPESACTADGTMPGLRVTDDGCELPRLQFAVSPALFEQLVADVLPPAKSWHKDLRAFGDVKRHDIRLWYEDGELREARVRIDLKEVTRADITRIVKLAFETGCHFLDVETQRVLPRDDAALLTAIQLSPSAKFVRHPRGFLESISNKAADDTQAAPHG